MRAMKPAQAMSGTWGEVWLDGEYLAQANKCRLEVNVTYEDVRQARKLMVGKKMSGLEGSGELGLTKVDSFVMKKVSDLLKAGRTPSFTIISKLDDPDAVGAERIVAYDCKFEKTTLADWEVGNIGAESYSFTFENWEITETAQA